MAQSVGWGRSEQKLKLFRELMGKDMEASHMGPLDVYAGSRLGLVSPLLGYNSYTTSQVRLYNSYHLFISHSDGLMARVHGKVMECKPELIHAVNPYEPFQELSVVDHPSYDCLVLAPDFLQSRAPELASLLASGAIDQGNGIEPDPTLDFYLKEFRHETSVGSRTSTQVVTSLEVLLLEKIGRSFRPGLQPTRAASHVVDMDGVLRFIDSHLADPLTVDELCRLAGMSRRVFFEQFRKRTQATPGEYIRAKRLARSRVLLQANPRGPLGDIALASGFSSHAYFDRVWRQKFGEAPSATRERLIGRGQA